MSLELGLGLGIYSVKYTNSVAPVFTITMDFSNAINSQYVAIISTFVG